MKCLGSDMRLVLVAAFTLAACGDGDVVAKVGRTKLRQADLALQLRARGGTSAPTEALDVLVDRALLAEGARREDLEEEPAVRAQVEASRREVLANAYLDLKVAHALTDEALRKRYESQREALARKQVNVAHIVVRVPPDSGERGRIEAQARINAIYARLLAGAEFAEVARESSEDPVTGQRGGVLGVLSEGQVDPDFFGAVEKLEKGRLSEPFRTAYGLHVARALEAPTRVVPPFEQARGRLAADARHEAMESLMKELREDVSVTRYPERLPAQAGAAAAAGRGPGSAPARGVDGGTP